MRLPRFTLVYPDTLVECVRILDEHRTDAKLLAGGTDLLPKMKNGLASPKYVVSLRRLTGELQFTEVDEQQGVIRIGAASPLAALAESPALSRFAPGVAYAAGCIGSAQIRNRATIGGNLCNAAPSADMAPILLVLGAKTTVQGPHGRRTIPIEELFAGPGETNLGRGEVLTEITVPIWWGKTAAVYFKHTVRQEMDIAMVGVACKITLDADGRCADAKIGLGAVSPTPVRARAAEDLLKGELLTGDISGLLEQVGELASRGCRPIDDVRASAHYRREMVKVMTRRAVAKALGIALKGRE